MAPVIPFRALPRGRGPGGQGPTALSDPAAGHPTPAVASPAAGTARADRLRTALARRLFSPLQGMTLSTWARVLWRCRFRLSPPFWPRVLLLSAGSLVNSAVAAYESRAYARVLGRADVPPPLFILGHYRSGTTHLLNLLSRDERFAYPTLYQAFFPRTFLTTEAALAPLVGLGLIRHRLQDGVALGVSVPMEDEIALGVATGLSPHLGWALPRHGGAYDRYLTFRDATAEEGARWKAALTEFAAKLTLRYGRPLLLKSPTHTGRIRLLLEAFPDARFVHIRRNPYDVFSSTLHMHRRISCYWRLQADDARDDDRVGRVLATYRAMYDAFFEQRSLIPAGRFHEIAYEDLVRDPLGVVAGVYGALGLPDFEPVRPGLRAYLDSVGAYARNPHTAPDEPLRGRIARAWGRCFDEWGYPRY